MLRDYLKSRLWVVVLVIACAGIMALVFFLFHLPLAVVLYPLALCFVLSSFLMWLDYRRISRRHREYQLLMESPGQFAETLPPPHSVAEADAMALLCAMEKKQQQESMERQKQENARMDYYTLWVHQIKTPIASMGLKLQQEDSPFSRSLQSDLNRISQYADMVLTYLRLAQGVSDFVIGEYDLDKILRNGIKKFSGEFIARHLQLDYTPTGKTVLTDEKWLSFVVEQLLSNALKYTNEGKISIYLEDDSLCIRDTGIGIAPEELPRVFERGYTGFNGRLDRHASGIGLYLCKRICETLHHPIEIASQLGCGTTVRLCLIRGNIFLE